MNKFKKGDISDVYEQGFGEINYYRGKATLILPLTESMDEGFEIWKVLLDDGICAAKRIYYSPPPNIQEKKKGKKK